MYFIEAPSEADVLCGKDKTYAKHPGNKLYRELIQMKATIYAGNCSKQDKMNITKEIVASLNNDHGSRFLRQAGEGWEEISEQQARDKTSHALRFCAKSAQRGRSASPVLQVAKKRKAPMSKQHRRTVSADQFPNVSGSSRYCLTDKLFHRQQTILNSFQQDDYACDTYPVEEVMSSQVHNLMTPDHVSSQDLDAILREPIEQDWVDLF